MVKFSPKTKGFINSALRRIFGWSDQYKACKERAFIGRVDRHLVYECEGCHQRLVKNVDDKFFVDHIESVVPIEGWVNDQHYASEIVNRMFVDVDGLQYLCSMCHYLKTQIENQERRASKGKLNE